MIPTPRCFTAAVAAIAAGLMTTASAAPKPSIAKPSFSSGRAETVVASLMPCTKVPAARVSGAGRVRSSDGKRWTVPSAVRFPGRPLPNLFNQCAGVTPADIAAVDLARIPMVEIDPDGEAITGYIFADNYFELYVNGVYVGSDPGVFTPFNAVVVRFRARRPVTYAVKLVDWEENLGLGSEASGDDAFHPGDGGFIASFSDGTVTDRSWRAQSYYIAPLASPRDVVENGSAHETPGYPTRYPEAPRTAACADRCFAAHYAVPRDWAAKSFDDRRWPPAHRFSEADVGATLPAYRNFRPQLTAGGASFIWSYSLVLDNLVLARKVGK